MFSRLDNKKKWRIVGIIAFVFTWAEICRQMGILDGQPIFGLVIYYLPSLIALWFLPFTQLVRGVVIIVYLFLMYPAGDQMFTRSVNSCKGQDNCL